MKPQSIWNYLFNVLKTISFMVVIVSEIYANSLNDVWMRSISKDLSGDLSTIKNEEMGFEYIQKLYMGFEYTSAAIDVNGTLLEISRKLESKIDDIFLSLERAQTAIEKMQYFPNFTRTSSNLGPCQKYQNNTSSCLKPGTKPSKDNFNIDLILDMFKTKMSVVKTSVYQQFFLSSSQFESFKDSTESEHLYRWKTYMNRVKYSSRNIVLLLDYGRSLSRQHFYLIKTIAKQLIESLTEDDKLALLLITNDWSSPQLIDDCLMPNQVPASANELPSLLPVDSSKKKIYFKFIDSMYKGITITNHTLGFEKALEIVKNEKVKLESVMILYISRGLFSSLTEARPVLETIATLSQNITSKVTINTCTVIDDSRPIIYETQFMEDLAHQNYEKYNISIGKNVEKGVMISVNSTDTIGFALVQFLNFFNVNNTNLKQDISLPFWHPDLNDFIITFSMGSLVDGNFGVLGVNVFFSNFTEELLYFTNSNHRDYYAFLIDVKGRVILHPKFVSLNMMKQKIRYADISNFENLPSFQHTRSKILAEVEGVQDAAHFGSKMRWTWRRVKNWYIICIVTRESSTQTRPYKIYYPFHNSTYKLVYNSLDSREALKPCRHLNQVATLDAGSLYLSPICFRSPSNSVAITDEVLPFIEDHTQLIMNPGLRDEIKDEVAALAHIMEFLHIRHLSSFKSKFIIRRYVASYSGVLQVYPGMIVNNGLDPTQRPWFQQAVEQQNSKLIVLPPYLDEGGAGYIVTLAFATSNVVVGIDVSYSYIFKLLLKRMPFCRSVNFTCFLMDDRGYLIYHPNLIGVNGHKALEKQHIVHKESLVANDLLTHDYFIKKLLCNSYGDGTIQRYYKLNTSYSEVLVNSVPAEHCVSYHITSVLDSNIFIGMLNATCNVMVTFCPCSIVDRLCLNCNRMEQKECECPCECPLEKKCTDFSDNSLCKAHLEHIAPSKAYFKERADDAMKACFPTNCAAESNHYRCLGTIGCEWCKYDVDGEPLSAPFCGSMATCFNGIVGAPTPYSNSFHDVQASEEESLNAPLSIITLLIFGVFLLLCMFYIYHRSHSTPAVEPLYISSNQQDNQLRMSDLNLSDNYHSSGNHRVKLLQDDKPDPVSPYCVTGSYKHAVVVADSDHGYSTMTQHDESEHLSLAPAEFNTLDDSHTFEKYQRSETTPFTSVPPKCIIVPVTVHRNRETT